jgi:protein-L-isoaspartate(D-aspartate) O-methyltransferase
MTWRAVPLVIACLAAPPATAQEADYIRARAAMVDTIRQQARVGGTFEPGPRADKVLDVMARTPRHLFVPERYRSHAYRDGPVPIGHDQTISQPLIVAAMTQLAEVESDHTVLEIGTGSGYQAAILAQLVRKVCTIEIVRPLGEAAAKLLRDLGHANADVRIGDGYAGWPECGPFDAIVVTAALGHVPPPLIDQLKIGGRLVMPVGPTRGGQQLTVVEKTAPASTKSRKIGPVLFVPFTRGRE